MVKYNLELLKDIVKRDDCIIDLEKYKDVSNRSVIIEYICKCGVEHKKVFRQVYENSGAFCKTCSSERISLKIKTTFIYKYGCENPSQCNEIKAKKKDTFIRKYGCENPSQLSEVREKRKATFIQKYGCENPSQLSQVKEKKKETCLKRFGVHYPMQSSEVREKSKNTNNHKYGVSNPMQSDEVKEKSKQTSIRKYGVTHPMKSNIVQDKLKNIINSKYGVDFVMQSNEMKAKSKQTLLRKFGVSNPSQSNVIQQKKRETCIRKFGCEHSSQSSEIHEKQMKSRYKLKEFIFPCGEKRLVQGYENIALDILVKQGFKAENLITQRDQIPEIWYYNNKKICRYFPDIYIPSEKKIIEVKSIWTYQKDYVKNLLKAKGCHYLGYSIEFWVFDKNGECNVYFDV